jgi:hypothetical protein
MAQNYLSGLVLPAMAGFFLFGKRAEAQELKDAGSLHSEDSSGLTGVSKYLKAHENIAPVTGVDKYLENLNRFQASGVTKYLRKQAVAEKLAAKQEALTGVAKYLKNQKDIPPVSGVARYIRKMDQTPASGVAKYMAKQAVAVRQVKAPVATGVARYLENQEQSPTSSVAKYMAKQAIAERQAEADRLAEAARQAEIAKQAAMETGVGKYLRNRG